MANRLSTANLISRGAAFAHALTARLPVHPLSPFRRRRSGVTRALKPASLLLVAAVLIVFIAVDAASSPVQAQTPSADASLESLSLSDSLGADIELSAEFSAATTSYNETVTVPRISRSDIPGYPKPKIEFDVGGQARIATFDSTSANSVLFTYNVAAGDQDSDGVSIDANKLSLSGGAIWDQAKNTPLTPESDGILN